MAQMVKNPPVNTEDKVSIPGSGRSPGEGNATHSIILAWEISWTKKPGRLQSMVLQSWTQLSDSTTTMLQYYLELQYYLPLLFRRHRYSGEAMSMVGRKKDITPRLTLYQEMLFLPAARPCCSDWTFSFLVSAPPPHHQIAPHSVFH